MMIVKTLKHKQETYVSFSVQYIKLIVDYPMTTRKEDNNINVSDFHIVSLNG